MIKGKCIVTPIWQQKRRIYENLMPKSNAFYEVIYNRLTNDTKFATAFVTDFLGVINAAFGVGVFYILFQESTARNLWKEIALWRRNRADTSVVILGDSLLAQSILSYGIQINLFSKKQCITYHVISEKQQFQLKHPDMPLLNGDTILYHESSGQDLWETVESADVIIVADKVSTEALQTLAVRAREKELYYYSPAGGNVGHYIAFGTPKAFGRDDQIFTDENIRRQGLIQTAIALNNQYAEKYGTEKDWNKLSGFLKSSNISSADFSEILTALPASMSEEELAELEHIRWCRFHYLNYWKKGTPPNGGSKDKEKRIHKDLVAYSELSEKDRDKDRAVVRMARKNAAC